ncbi:N-acetyltransferase [Candidatus Woesearchaeota archaeon]|nr:N-acetyltransferase [Candidatus Woesearchaeota archaeon]
MKTDPTWKIGSNAAIGEKSLRSVKDKTARIGKNAKFLSSSIVYEGVKIGDGLIIGHNSVIREENAIGKNFRLWNNSVVDYGCKIGDNVKVHCNCYIAQGTAIEDGVFIGPGTVTTNDKYPGSRLSTPEIAGKDGPRIKKGAQIGANVTILPGVTIGERALVGSGSVVTKDIPKETVAFGNPAKPVCSIYGLKDEYGKPVYEKHKNGKSK